MKRKPISKIVRQHVYEKYNGHCAYCGCELDIKDMQVDHLDSVYRAECEGREVDNSIDNFMPACRQCNFYKGTSTIYEFRKKITNLKRTALIAFQVRLAQKYGIMRAQSYKGKVFVYKDDWLIKEGYFNKEYLA